MQDCHEFQRQQVGLFFREGYKVLNVACKEDPARLGLHFNATNLDLYDHDPHTGCHLSTDIPNFVQGSATALPFENESFDILVIGELLEHCLEHVVRQILVQAYRVLKVGGKLILTFPLDGRAPEKQHAKHLLVDWADGITSWHQSIWDKERLLPILSQYQFILITLENLSYPFLRDQSPQGHGMVLMKGSDLKPE